MSKFKKKMLAKTISYQEFKDFVKKGFDEGSIKAEGSITKYTDFTELDLAIQYVISKKYEKRQEPFDITLEELCDLIYVLCGRKVFDKCFGGSE